MNKIWIIAQVLTVLSYVIFWASRYLKTKRQILVVDYISRFLGIIGYLIIFNFDGVKSEILALCRGFVAYGVIKKSKKVRIIISIIVSLISIMIYMLGYTGIPTICTCVTSCINIYGNFVCDEQGMRICTLIGAFFYLSFEILTKMYGGAVCELIGIIVIFISYLKYRTK